MAEYKDRTWCHCVPTCLCDNPNEMEWISVKDFEEWIASLARPIVIENDIEILRDE